RPGAVLCQHSQSPDPDDAPDTDRSPPWGYHPRGGPMSSHEPVEPVEAVGQEPQPNPLGDALEVLFGFLAPAIAAGQGLAPTVRRISNWGPVRGVAGATGRTLDGWRARGRTEQKRFLEALDEFVRQTMPQIIDAVLDRI